MNSKKQREKAQLKNISIKLREDQIEQLKLKGVSNFSDFFRGLTEKWLDESTLENISEEEQLLVLGRKADMAEKEIERLESEPAYLKCLRGLKAVDEFVKIRFRDGLYHIDIFTDDDYEKNRRLSMEELSKLTPKITRDQWRKIATLTRKISGQWFRLLSDRDIKNIKNWRRNKIHKETQEKLIELAEQRAGKAREEVKRYYEKTKKA